VIAPSNTVLRMETETTVETVDIPHPPHVHQPLVDLVVKALRGEGHCPSTGESAMRATQFMNEMTGRP